MVEAKCEFPIKLEVNREISILDDLSAAAGSDFSKWEYMGYRNAMYLSGLPCPDEYCITGDNPGQKTFEGSAYQDYLMEQLRRSPVNLGEEGGYPVRRAWNSMRGRTFQYT